METSTTLFLLLIVASGVAMAARRLQLPYTVTLVLAGASPSAPSTRARRSSTSTRSA